METSAPDKIQTSQHQVPEVLEPLVTDKLVLHSFHVYNFILVDFLILFWWIFLSLDQSQFIPKRVIR